MHLLIDSMNIGEYPAHELRHDPKSPVRKHNLQLLPKKFIYALAGTDTFNRLKSLKRLNFV